MRVLLIGWDAADWKVINPLMDSGKMPNVQRLVENGAMAHIATLHPPLSPMLWTSIATGKRPFKHGINGFAEPTPDGRGVQPVTNLSRKCKALWNILSQNDLRSIVTGWWPSHPSEPINGVMVSNHYQTARGPLEKGWPMLPGAVHPPDLANTLAELRFHPDEVIPSLIEPFIPLAKEIDQEKDHRLANCMKTLCECVSIHSAATWLLQNQPWDFFAVYYDAIDHFCHGFMRYHPPRQEHIPERDFDLYHNVVSQAYQFHDQMLGTLLRLAGDGVRVILMSDHGFHPDHLRPRYIPDIPAGPAIEHRDLGILVMSGPGIKKDELLHGADLLDITPTVLSMFGLPMAEDMDGKVLVGAFEEAPPVLTIQSWEDVPGADGSHPPHTRLDAVAATESLEQLIALGYIERPDENVEKAVANTVRELRYNLGEAYQDAGRHAEAFDIFHELYEADRDEQRFGVHLFFSCQALGRVDKMSSIVEELDGPRRALYTEALNRLQEFGKLAEQRAKSMKEMPPESLSEEDAAEKLFSEEERREISKWRKNASFQPPVVDYLKAQLLTAQRKWSEALRCLERVTSAHLTRPGLFLQTAELYIRMQRWEEAEKIYSKALEIDPDNPHAHIGICRAALHRRDYELAVDAALEGLQRLYWNPVGHLLLGRALVGMRDYERAAEALRAALAVNPNYRQAHRRLAYLLKRHLNDPKGAEAHLRAAQSPGVRRLPSRPAHKAEAKKNMLASWPSPQTECLPPLNGEVVVVSGLPRSGTSMLMQMLSAGGLITLTDGVRQADADNPRGYFEFEPVKRMRQDAGWLSEAHGKAVKIVAPLIPDIPPDTAIRVIFIERNLDEILASQRQMIVRRGQHVSDAPGRYARLKEQYRNSMERVKSFLSHRPGTQLLCLESSAVLRDPQTAAESINRFLGGQFNVTSMASQVNPALNRQRA
jgi:predicted AlkP superfamily phosphohydrolase/phosphomutase/tetratricopeptide (TPR) repeat protein